jgi:hypothetical protein
MPSGSFVVTDVPGAPSGVNVTTSGTTANVSFTPGPDGGSAVSGYTAQCASNDGGVLRSASSAASPVSVTALTSGRTYTCVVRSTNAVGAGPWSVPSSTFVVPTVPAAPSGIKVTRSGTTAVVAFTPGANGGSPITSYVAKCISSDGGTTRARRGPASPIPVPDLTDGNTYTCRVKAINVVGSSPFSTRSRSFVV